MPSLRTAPAPVLVPAPVHRPARPAPADERGRLLDRFNAAVRVPAAHGGVACLPPLLDALALAEGGAEPDGARWIVDSNARLNAAAMMRRCFPDPEIHEVASEYGAAAYRRGWLRLDRTLPVQQHTHVVETAETWVEEDDRTLDQVLQTYGRPSVTFGDPDPCLPKTLGYASADHDIPLAVFHFAQAADTPSARLLAFRAGEGPFGARMAFTPFGWTAGED
ncbi:hypothetical protein ACEZCY_14920 [Streptacidiphilus sp. N1-12]|uniref:Uncharacterized protein n=2 Tax=Streptacidiphilus alkalitolerans TaxID=3342712 RepID=A0ABV6VAA3_9ACTN